MKQSSHQSSNTKNSNPCAKFSIILIVLFLVAFIGTFLVSQILRSHLIDQSISETKGSVYPNISKTTTQFTADELGSAFSSSALPTLSSTAVEAVRSGNGTIVGSSTSYQLEAPVQVIDKSVVADFLTTDPAKLPASEIPIVVPADSTAFQPNLDYLKKLSPDTTYSVVGSIPGLDGIYLVNDGTTKTTDFLATIIHADSFAHLSTLSVTRHTIAKFDNLNAAESYLKEHATDDTATIFSSAPVATSPIGNTFSIVANFTSFYNIFYAASLVALIVIILIILFCLLFTQKHHHNSNESTNPRRTETKNTTKSSKNPQNTKTSKSAKSTKNTKTSSSSKKSAK